MRSKWILKCVMGFLALIGIASLAIMLLWNYVIVEVFHLEAITYLQALALFIFAKILFKGNPGWMAKGGFKNELKKNMENMSPEERERFRAQWEKRCNKWSQECKDDE